METSKFKDLLQGLSVQQTPKPGVNEKLTTYAESCKCLSAGQAAADETYTCVLVQSCLPVPTASHDNCKIRCQRETVLFKQPSRNWLGNHGIVRSTLRAATCRSWSNMQLQAQCHTPDPLRHCSMFIWTWGFIDHWRSLQDRVQTRMAAHCTL